MKLSWGHYILFAFTGFVILILFMVFSSFQRNHDLVAEDYYSQELQYQDIIEKRQRANKLETNISWKNTTEGLEFIYPQNLGTITGKISLMCPSDKSKDLEVFIDGSTSKQIIPSVQLATAKYQIQCDWKANGISYFTEGVAFVQP